MPNSRDWISPRRTRTLLVSSSLQAATASEALASAFATPALTAAVVEAAVVEAAVVEAADAERKCYQAHFLSYSLSAGISF